MFWDRCENPLDFSDKKPLLELLADPKQNCTKYSKLFLASTY